MMLGLFTSRTEHMGMPPGALPAAAAPGSAAGKSRLSLISYRESEFAEEPGIGAEAALAGIARQEGVCWLNIDGLGDVPMLAQVGQAMGLHPLTLEDVLTPDQRPKMDLCEGYIFLVLKMLSVGGDGALHSEQVSLVFDGHRVVTFQQHEGDVFGVIRERLRQKRGRVRQAGALLDAVVDHYFLVMEHYSEQFEELDARVMTEGRPETLQAIHRLKRELAEVRRAAWPLRDLISGLERADTPLLHRATRPYLRDLYDNAVHIIDTVEIFREMASGLLDVHLSVVGNRMNEIMKVLTLIATVFMPLTFIAGIYGMNFVHMPELAWRYGYAAALAVMAGVAVAMIAFFRRRHWL